MAIANRMAAAPRRPKAHQFRPCTRAHSRQCDWAANRPLPKVIGVASYPKTPNRRRLSDIPPPVARGKVDRSLAVGEVQPVERGERISGGRPPHQRLDLL